MSVQTTSTVAGGVFPDTRPMLTTKHKRPRFALFRNTKALVGMIILSVFLVLAVIGPWIAPYDPSAVTREALAPPSVAHWLGTTNTGQDILSQLLVGTQGVMVVGLIAGVLATAISIVIGVTAGFIGGTGDELLSLLSNVFLVIPALPLIIIIAGIALLIPGANLTAIIASGFIGTVIFAILSEVTLAFIGVTSISAWNWGTVLFWAQSSQALILGAWWWFVPAGLCIAAVGTALTLINFGIDEFVNPRLRNTAASASVLRAKKIRARIGFTPIYRGVADSDAADSAATGLDRARAASGNDDPEESVQLRNAGGVQL